jgi:hypothetical protein
MAPPIVNLTTEKAFATFRVDSMLKPELVRRVADQSPHLHRSDVEEVVNAVFWRRSRQRWCAGTESSYGLRSVRRQSEDCANGQKSENR